MQIIPLKQGNDTYVSIDQSFFYKYVSGRISVKTFQAVAFGASWLRVSGIEIGNFNVL